MKNTFYQPSQQRGLIYLFSILLLISSLRQWLAFSKAEEEFLVKFFPQKEAGILDINSASADAFESLEGIGPILARRIVSFRNKLGGYNSISQLNKVYGLEDSVIKANRNRLCVDSLNIRQSAKVSFRKKKTYKILDLNTANESQLEDLPGIGKKISRRIIKFREARRGFSSVSELRKIYGFSSENFQKASPYLKVYPKEKKNIEKVDLNKADNHQLMSLPGIGQKLSDRILKYRKLLGFFSRKEQLLSVYGLKRETFASIQPFILIEAPLPMPAKNINTANSWQLAVYPLVSKEVAESIVRERNIKGNFDSWEEIGQVPGLDPKALEELKSHFNLQDKADNKSGI